MSKYKIQDGHVVEGMCGGYANMTLPLIRKIEALFKMAGRDVAVKIIRCDDEPKPPENILEKHHKAQTEALNYLASIKNLNKLKDDKLMETKVYKTGIIKVDCELHIVGKNAKGSMQLSGCNFKPVVLKVNTIDLNNEEFCIDGHWFRMDNFEFEKPHPNSLEEAEENNEHKANPNT